MTPPSVPPLFDADPAGSDAYKACRDHVTKQDVREALERAWSRVHQLCPEKPEQFVRQFRQDFHARAWELFLMAVLTDAAVELEPTGGKGPDIRARLASGRRCWIEAVAPTPGAGDNAVFQRPPGPWSGALYKDNNLILRYRSVLEEKLKKLDGYKAEGIVGPDDAYLIAVYQGTILDSDLHDDDLPALARAVLPIGETVLNVVPYSGEPPTVETLTREAVRKKNTAPVSTTFFLEERTKYVSGILFARQAVWNLPWSAAASLGLIHRAGATNPVPHGEIPTRCELWVDDEGIVRHRGRCAQFGAYSKDESDAAEGPL